MNPIIYKQIDSRWSSLPYPTKKSTFGGNGCGCCSCVHAAIEMPDKANWTPENLRQWMINQGFAVAGKGTTWEGIVATLQYLGYKNVVWVKYKDPMSKAWAELDKGNRIGVLLVDDGKTPDGTYWTSSGHYVFFGDYKIEDGQHKFNIKDSGGRNHDGWFSYERSMKGALPQLFIVERIGEPLPTPTPKKGTYNGEYPNPKKYLEFGDKGTEVTKWQHYLNWSFGGQEGFTPMAEDGIYGNDTYRWTCVFQEKAIGAGQGDGKVGQKTIAKAKELGGGEPTPPQPRKYDGQYPNPKKYLEKGDRGTEVTKLQHYINWYFNPKYGKNVIAEDGIYGVNTLYYCELMQAELGFAPPECDGKVGQKTIAKMKEYGGYTPSSNIFDRGVEWLYSIAADNSWHYVKYNSKDAKTKECPICHNHAVGKYHGWNCIGESFAFWRHGCGIPCNCANNVINNAVADKLLTQSDADALATLRKKIGLNDIQVIRNGGKDIPQSWLKRGDICLNYRSGKYYHTFPYIGDGYTIDCGNYSSTAKQIAKRKAPSCKVAIRYIGK